MRLSATGGATLASTDHALQIGTDDAVANLIFDRNEIQARDNGAAAALLLNQGGGNLTIGSASSVLAMNGTISGAVIATKAQAEAMTDDAHIMTPLRTAQAMNVTGAAPMFACRAWVCFDGTGTPAILGSGNVASITDNGTGDYTITFTTALPSANYAAVMSVDGDNGVPGRFWVTYNTKTTTALRISVKDTTGTQSDVDNISVAIFG
jgi:hypothetical protein